MKHCIVTGGAGFIGKAVVLELLSSGCQVLIIDNFNDFYNPAIKRQNIAELTSAAAPGQLTVAEGDIRDRDFLTRACCDFAKNTPSIIHLAAMAGVRPSIADPELYVQVNIDGTLNMLELCRRYKIRNFIFGSSSSVYGNNKKVPFAETDPVDNPISPYAATKKAGELLCHTYHHLFGISILALRFFTVYGPGQRPDLAIHKFSKMILDDQPLPFFGDGSTRRDYTYIDDIKSGIIKSLAHVEAAKNPIFEILNLGESETITLSEMVAVLEEALGKKAGLDRQPMAPGDVVATFADIDKARKLIGYNPQTAFKDGVASFVAWLKKSRAT